jgi:hypothetical protein
VANASHELRTPLAVERTLLQVALDDPEADAATLREACEEVLAVGARTERLIDALLTLASGERGIERREPFDLADLAARVAQTRGEEAARRDVRLEAKLGPAPAAGDPRLAESLIANLADNALRYNVPGGWAEISTATHDGRAVVSGAQHRPGDTPRSGRPPFPAVPATRDRAGPALPRPRARPRDRRGHRRRPRRLDHRPRPPPSSGHNPAPTRNQVKRRRRKPCAASVVGAGR